MNLLIGADWDRIHTQVVLNFYDTSRDKIVFWPDTTGYRPYCLSKQPIDRLTTQFGDSVAIDEVIRYDLLEDKEIAVRRITADDPVIIRGAPDTHESDIPVNESYLYDMGLIVGTWYNLDSGRPVPVEYKPEESMSQALSHTINHSNPELASAIKSLAAIMNQPIPSIKRAALDIEVLPLEGRMPQADVADRPLIGASLVGSDGLKRVYVLLRIGQAWGDNTLSEDVKFKSFYYERDLVAALFRDMLEYPCILTFNGDDFDLMYLYHRAKILGFEYLEIPIKLGYKQVTIKHGFHIDLYRTFSNVSLQNYAFNGRYKEKSLEAISEGLLGETKLKFEGDIGELDLFTLAKYNERDAELTLKLSSFQDDILMKLLVLIGRVSKLPIETLARSGASGWNRSMMYFACRQLGYLIPQPSELQLRAGNQVAVAATIKGKKYKGALVLEPSAGVHFGVSVLDFASLYPSLIKIYNISFETIKCMHPDCRSNRVPETDYWYCSRRTGVESLVIGSLRDLRVEYYKHLIDNVPKDQRPLLKTISQALKVIMNASYGTLGFASFNLYFLPAAEAITALGRYSISQAMQHAEFLGIKVIYSDTDSCFVEHATESQISQLRAWVSARLGVDMDVDKEYRYVCFSNRKKNYFGILKNGDIDIKGLTGKKSNTPKFIRQTFNEVMSMLKSVETPRDFEQAKSHIIALLRTKLADLKAGAIPLEALAFNVMLQKEISAYVKNPQHVKAAKQLMLHTGRIPKIGEVISFVKTTSAEGAIPIQLAKPTDIDIDKYVETLSTTFDQLLSTMGSDFDEVEGATKLDSYFKPWL